MVIKTGKMKVIYGNDSHDTWTHQSEPFPGELDGQSDKLHVRCLMIASTKREESLPRRLECQGSRIHTIGYTQASKTCGERKKSYLPLGYSLAQIKLDRRWNQWHVEEGRTKFHNLESPIECDSTQTAGT